MPTDWVASAILRRKIPCTWKDRNHHSKLITHHSPSMIHHHHHYHHHHPRRRRRPASVPLRGVLSNFCRSLRRPRGLRWSIPCSSKSWLGLGSTKRITIRKCSGPEPASTSWQEGSQGLSDTGFVGFTWVTPSHVLRLTLSWSGLEKSSQDITSQNNEKS